MNDNQGNGMVTGFLFGAVVGAGLALLMAPASGSDTRRRLRETTDDLRHKAGDKLDALRGRAEGLKDDLHGKLDKVGHTVREGARDVEAAVNEGFGAFQKAAGESGSTSKRS